MERIINGTTVNIPLDMDFKVISVTVRSLIKIPDFNPRNRISAKAE